MAEVSEDGAPSGRAASDRAASTDPTDEPTGATTSEAGTSPVSGASGLGAHLDRLATLQSTVDELVAASAREHDRAAFRESMIDRLHAENQGLRRGESDALLDPVREGIVGVYDMARRAAAQYLKTDQPSAERGAALLETVAEEAADVLKRIGVTRIDPVVGELFDAGRHRAVATRSAAQPSQDNTVADVGATGFTMVDKVIRRAEVTVARHLAGQPEDAQGVASGRDPV